ncbi:MAG: lipid-A-disaccharide synthase [Planctomycetes bacterium]|nr:lipid-A-disaccharide synthase [Planctomycetota bacterium]
MHVFISTGEPSGDLHGGNLIRALRQRDPSLSAVGYGGPHMKSAGCDVLFPLTDLALMWFLRVGLNLHRFVALIRKANRYFREKKPDAVIVIDFPGFNWWIARRAHAHGIPVFYFVPPQLWAWAPWRISKMRKWVDHVLCSLPFEAEWYENRGVRATYVGHPFYDEIEGRVLDHDFIQEHQSVSGCEEVIENARSTTDPLSSKSAKPIVGLLPGSRKQEVTSNFPIILRSAQLLQKRIPEARFWVACFSVEHEELIRSMSQECSVPLELYLGRTPEVIHASTVCLSVSGSVSLELLSDAKPTVIVYKVSASARWAARKLMHCPYITLVNLLAAEELYPEFLTDNDPSQEVSEHLYRWLSDVEFYKSTVDKLIRLREQYAHAGASRRAAGYIVDTLNRSAKTSSTVNASSPGSTLGTRLSHHRKVSGSS